MKAYFSFWSGGWWGGMNPGVENCHKIAVSLAKRNFDEVHLITDSVSAGSFKAFGFDSIETLFDGMPPEYVKAWSLSKIVAFKHICSKGDPFIHLDYDTFLYDGLPNRLKTSRVFGPNPDTFNAISDYEVEVFLKHCPNLHLLGKVNPLPNRAINMGIFGGTDLEFISKYCGHALELGLDEANREFFFEKDLVSRDWIKAVVLEQYMIQLVCDFYGVDIDLWFPHWPNEEEAFLGRYTHLMGKKRCPQTMEKARLIASKLN